MRSPAKHRIVIVGGGAGGLELATHLGNSLGKRGRADVTLILALGSLSNDFGTPGVREHALRLESKADAQRFHARMVNACIRAHAQATPLRPEQLHVAIIGAGATGVELAAELHRTTREVIAYGLDRVDADRDIQVMVIEAAERVLPALPARLSEATGELLRELGVVVHTRAQVAEVLPDGVRLADGRTLPAELVVWAAGVKAADFLKDIAGLETNRINQLVVRPTLQTTRDEVIFAIGDCAACSWPASRWATTATATSARWCRWENSAPWVT
jgi:NADH:ubiquinone reductase (H+-translocating)